MNVLLVEDDYESRVGLAQFLRELGHHVVECEDGQEALKLAYSGDFQIVLTDLEIPKLSGLELLRALSVLPVGKKLNVILFMGYGDLESAIEALRAGAYDYLLKPVNVEHLAQIIERAELQEKAAGNAKTVKVLIADNNYLTREGLKSILIRGDSYYCLGEASNLQETLREMEKNKPDVVIAHEQIACENDFDLYKALKKYHSNTCLIVFVSEGDLKKSLQSIKAGASAVLLTSGTEPTEILYVIKKVCEGGKFIDARITEKLLEGGIIGAEEERKLNLLTEQEKKILSSLALGRTNKETAAELFLSPATIRNYLSNILKKLDLPNRAAATAFAIKYLTFREEKNQGTKYPWY